MTKKDWIIKGAEIAPALGRRIVYQQLHGGNMFATRSRYPKGWRKIAIDWALSHNIYGFHGLCLLDYLLSMTDVRGVSDVELRVLLEDGWVEAVRLTRVFNK